MKKKFRILGKRGLSGASEYLLIFLMVLAAGLLASMPWWLKFYLTGRTTLEYYYEYMILLYLSGIVAEIIMWNGFRLMHNINNSQPFIMQNAQIINRIAYSCLAVTIIYAVAIPFIPSFFTVLISLIFIVITIICFVCGELFKQAVLFKEENELTI